MAIDFLRLCVVMWGVFVYVDIHMCVFLCAHAV